MSELTAVDTRWLDAAARFATPFLGTTADNPAVAALLVDAEGQRLIARAVTARGGRPHAEAQALETAGYGAAGCTLYTTLEPCHHWGRVPPCVDAIVRAGVMRVVIGTTDPRHPGESVQRLEQAGVEVLVADHAPSRALHAGHLLRHRRNRPQVTVAMVHTGKDSAALRCLDMLRTRADAILIDAATARVNDATLVVALSGLSERTPLRIILADREGTDRKMNLIGGFSGYRTAVIAETDAEVDAPASVEVIRIAGSGEGVDLGAALATLAARGMQNLLVEATPDLAGRLAEAGLLDRGIAYLSEGAEVDAPFDGPAYAEVERIPLDRGTLVTFAPAAR